LRIDRTASSTGTDYVEVTGFLDVTGDHTLLVAGSGGEDEADRGPVPAVARSFADGTSD
jgi:hypothetical protein